MYEIAAYLNQEFWDNGDAFGTARSLGFTSVEIPASRAVTACSRLRSRPSLSVSHGSSRLSRPIR